jgi:hypothetical protein
MVNIKPVIVNTLKNSLHLVELLKGSNIYRQYPEKEFDFSKESLVVYSEIKNEPLEKGDEVELISDIRYQFDIWSKSSTSEISLEIDRVMTELGGERIDASDDDENAPKQCKPMVYKFIVDNEGTIY